MNSAPDTRIYIDADKKALIQQVFGVDLNSELFDPRFDYVAKRILTAESPQSKKALISFLNAALKFKADNSIIDLVIINTEIPVDSKNYKKSKFDIRVKLENGEQAIVEIEFNKKDNFKKRSQFIISKAYSSQEISGKTYGDLKRCYLICIVDFILFDDEKDYYRDGMFRDAKGNPITDDQIIIFLELTKIYDLLNKPVEELTNLECWLLFFKYITDKSKRDIMSKIFEREEGVLMAAQILETISRDEKERAIYEAQWLYEMDQQSELISAERRAKREVAKGLKRDGFPLDAIAKNTGIPMEELIKL